MMNFKCLLLLALGLACGAAMAQPAGPGATQAAVPAVKPAKGLSIKLPPETAALKPSILPGYQLALQKCGICHSADYIKLQPPAMTQPQWTAEVRKMQHAYAAPLSDQDINAIGEYLAVAYGGAQPAPSAVSAVPAPPVAPPAAARAVDVQALLGANACLGCHAINQKIVGPAYRDVALKYKGDAQAQARLEASIRAGSAGKWGAVPMPAFAALSPQELKALAAFVLRQ
ncbi:MAG: cytochrome [Polaromonas sp.]|nr:cytochrome [Polaromonas sp.]